MAKKNDTTTPPAEKAQTVSLNSDVRITFVERENSPERLVCEAELVFGAGLLAGMKLVGFSLWKSPEGEFRHLPVAGVRRGVGAALLRLPAQRRG